MRRFITGWSLVGFIGAAIVGAQEPPAWRAQTSAAHPFLVSSGTVGATFYIDASTGVDVGKLTWFQNSPLAPNEVGFTGECQIPLNMPGDIEDGPGVDRFLVVGYDSIGGAGRIVYIQFDTAPPTSASVLASMSLGANVDPVDVHWSESSSRLFIIDRRSKIVWSAAWAAGQPLPGAYVPILNGATAPFLDGTNFWGFTENDAHSILVTKSLSSEYYVLVENGGVWSVASHPYDPGPPLTAVEVDAPEAANALWPVKVRGPAGAVEVLDQYTGTVVLNDIIQGDIWTELSAPNPMIPGHLHRVTQGASSALFLPLARYGESESANGIGVREGYVAWDQYYVGNEKFGVATTVALENPALAPYSIDVYLWIAAGLPGGAPPITNVGNAVVLIAADTEGPLQFTLKNEDPIARIGVEYPIPSDAELEGVRLYFQFASTAPGSAVSVSDVFAVDVMGSAQMSTLHSSGRLGAVGQPPREARKRAIRKWLGRGLEPLERSVYEAMVEQLLRQQ